MSRIEQLHTAFRRNGRSGPALIAFLAAGDPDYETTVALAVAAVEAGADVIELGSPFSDPLADGPIIQAAYARALAGGASTAGTIACAAEIQARTGVPVVLMVALNCVLSFGEARFCREAAGAGVSGLLVPDLPADDAALLREHADRCGIGTVFLVGPDSGTDRVIAAAAAATGFVYLLRRRGITGSGEAAIDLGRRTAEVRRVTPVPVAVGFGIATAADAREVADVADGVIVGSALVEAAFAARLAAPEPDRARRTAAREVGARVHELARALATERMGAGS